MESFIEITDLLFFPRAVRIHAQFFAGNARNLTRVEVLSALIFEDLRALIIEHSAEESSIEIFFFFFLIPFCIAYFTQVRTGTKMNNISTLMARLNISRKNLFYKSRIKFIYKYYAANIKRSSDRSGIIQSINIDILAQCFKCYE